MTSTSRFQPNKNDEGDKNSQGVGKLKKKVVKGITVNPKKEDLMSEKLDPVGKEDADLDNDGKKNDKNDRYLRYRRKVRSSVIKNQKEALEALRTKELAEEEVVNEVAVTAVATPAAVGSTSHSNTKKGSGTEDAKKRMREKLLAQTAEYDKKRKEARHASH
tara:strand:- start:2415 stop:2900 length:486 start_codon:yes stop_codon:yes gene_type:complete